MGTVQNRNTSQYRRGTCPKGVCMCMCAQACCWSLQDIWNVHIEGGGKKCLKEEGSLCFSFLLPSPGNNGLKPCWGCPLISVDSTQKEWLRTHGEGDRRSGTGRNIFMTWDLIHKGTLDKWLDMNKGGFSCEAPHCHLLFHSCYSFVFNTFRRYRISLSPRSHSWDFN